MLALRDCTIKDSSLGYWLELDRGITATRQAIRTTHPTQTHRLRKKS